MTTRQRLNRRLKWTGGTMYVGLGLCILGVFLGRLVGQGPNVAVLLPGIAITAVASIVGHVFLLKCHRCRGNLAPLTMNRGMLSVNPRFNYCPYCGYRIDEEI